MSEIDKELQDVIEEVSRTTKDHAVFYGPGTEKYVIPQHEPGAKLDNGKPDASLLLMFGHALSEIARVGTFGANKYTRGGWQHVPDGQNRYTAALLRHLFAEHYEDLDGESGIEHAAHAAWNAIARLELKLREERNKHESV